MKKYKNILRIYDFFWKKYSAAVVQIDQHFSEINKVVNTLYYNIEKDEDVEADA